MIYKILKSAKLTYKILNDKVFAESFDKSNFEVTKQPSRTDILNYLLNFLNRETTYLEIGVRNPNDNFIHIRSNSKYSVDPGYEFEQNPVDFRLTSDEFFTQLASNLILENSIRFDVIFIDGLHLAEQVNRDIINSLQYIKDDGFIVLHDCNPPTEWHARENYYFFNSPAKCYWNGTTWKAFLKYRFDESVHSCCVDSDWGVGIITKSHPIGDAIPIQNPFYEYNVLDNNRKELLNLVSFDSLKKLLNK